MGHRKRGKASKKKAEGRNHEEELRVNGGFGLAGHGYYGPSNNGYGYGYGYPRGYFQYPYGRQRRHHHYNEYVATAPLTYRDGFNQYGCLHFSDADPYRCYQSFYETPFTSFPQAPPPRQLHPFYTPETVCAIM